MLLHRICTTHFAGTAKLAFGGQGGIYGSGRWHQRGRPIVYTSAHRSLALLEIMVHLDARWHLQPMEAWEIEVPESFIRIPVDLPDDWKYNLEGTRAYGDAWLASRGSVALRVPSVIVPSEFNVLINPSHPEFNLDWVRKGPESMDLDPRLI